MECPKHYQLSTLFRKDGTNAEVIDICDELAPHDPDQFQAIEYLLRCKKKGQEVADLEKCKFYIDRMIYKAEANCTNCANIHKLCDGCGNGMPNYAGIE